MTTSDSVKSNEQVRIIGSNSPLTSDRSPMRKFIWPATEVPLLLLLLLLFGQLPGRCGSWTFNNVFQHHADSTTTTTIGCLQLLSGFVGGGNYTYYRLSHEGDIVLLLDTSLGDADIYASQDHLQPTFDLNGHDLQSVTCGLDQIHIPDAFKRPVGIGVYGHPSREMSVYQLCVNLISVPPAISNSFDSDAFYDGDSDDRSDQSSNRGGSPRMPYYDKDDHEDSVLWSLLISALKVLIEILT